MKRGKLKDVIILLSLISTLIITGCGGGNNGGGNAARNAQNEQIEAPQMLADANQDVITEQPLVDRTLEQNREDDTNQLDNITNTDTVETSQSSSQTSDTTGTENTELVNTDSTSSTNTSTDDVLNIKGTVVAADNSENKFVEDFDVNVAFAKDLNPSNEFDKISRVTSLNTSKGENTPLLATELGE